MKLYWACGLGWELAPEPRQEEQDVGPQASAIMSGVFIVFVFIKGLSKVESFNFLLNFCLNFERSDQ